MIPSALPTPWDFGADAIGPSAITSTASCGGDNDYMPYWEFVSNVGAYGPPASTVWPFSSTESMPSRA